MDMIAKALTISLIVVLVIILPSLFGDSVATHSPSVFAAIHYILQVIWRALQDIFQVGHHV
ncbi:MAG: hypothetical protein DLM60_10365 [Pseudonocardiales bacterium]|nr:MAG: hypothetical protein DLM60_10365 [Pseudonocardiales bacterium]